MADTLKVFTNEQVTTSKDVNIYTVPSDSSIHVKNALVRVKNNSTVVTSLLSFAVDGVSAEAIEAAPREIASISFSPIIAEANSALSLGVENINEVKREVVIFYLYSTNIYIATLSNDDTLTVEERLDTLTKNTGYKSLGEDKICSIEVIARDNVYYGLGLYYNGGTVYIVNMTTGELNTVSIDSAINDIVYDGKRYLYGIPEGSTTTLCRVDFLDMENPVVEYLTLPSTVYGAYSRHTQQYSAYGGGIEYYNGYIYSFSYSDYNIYKINAQTLEVETLKSTFAKNATYYFLGSCITVTTDGTPYLVYATTYNATSSPYQGVAAINLDTDTSEMFNFIGVAGTEKFTNGASYAELSLGSNVYEIAPGVIAIREPEFSTDAEVEVVDLNTKTTYFFDSTKSYSPQNYPINMYGGVKTAPLHYGLYANDLTLDIHVSGVESTGA